MELRKLYIMDRIYNKTFHAALTLPERFLSKSGNIIKPEMVDFAINLKSGLSKENQLFHNIYEASKYRVAMAKPGKEVYIDTLKHKEGRLTNNQNDMRPVIFEDNLKLNDDKTFTAIFEEFQKLGRADEKALELLACLLFRNAFVLDHIKKGNQWIYNPPMIIVDEISKTIDEIYKVPVIVFLHFLDGLALNEDVKYHTLGYDIKGETGRRNNLLTCVNIIGVFLNKVQLVKFAGAFARPPVGISAISQKLAIEIFPLLDPKQTF